MRKYFQYTKLAGPPRRVYFSPRCARSFRRVCRSRVCFMAVSCRDGAQSLSQRRFKSCSGKYLPGQAVLVFLKEQLRRPPCLKPRLLSSMRVSLGQCLARFAGQRTPGIPGRSQKHAFPLLQRCTESFRRGQVHGRLPEHVKTAEIVQNENN